MPTLRVAQDSWAILPSDPDAWRTTVRRSLFLSLAAALLAALAVSAVSLAGGGDDQAAADRPAPAADARGLLAAANTGTGSGLPDPQAILRSLAGRLDVGEAELRDALEAVGRRQSRAALDRAEDEGRVTGAEHDVLAACAQDDERCDRAEARQVLRGLHDEVSREDLREVDLGALKADVAGDVASELDRTPAQVTGAVRAELDAGLGGLATSGLLTERARGLALACFDDPDACDAEALEKEVPLLRELGGHLGRAG